MGEKEVQAGLGILFSTLDSVDLFNQKFVSNKLNVIAAIECGINTKEDLLAFSQILQMARLTNPTTLAALASSVNEKLFEYYNKNR
jgi:hypothetical protein